MCKRKRSPAGIAVTAYGVRLVKCPSTKTLCCEKEEEKSHTFTNNMLGNVLVNCYPVRIQISPGMNRRVNECIIYLQVFIRKTSTNSTYEQ